MGHITARSKESCNVSLPQRMIPQCSWWVSTITNTRATCSSYRMHHARPTALPRWLRCFTTISAFSRPYDNSACHYSHTENRWWSFKKRLERRTCSCRQYHTIINRAAKSCYKSYSELKGKLTGMASGSPPLMFRYWPYHARLEKPASYDEIRGYEKQLRKARWRNPRIHWRTGCFKRFQRDSKNIHFRCRCRYFDHRQLRGRLLPGTTMSGLTHASCSILIAHMNTVKWQYKVSKKKGDPAKVPFFYYVLRFILFISIWRGILRYRGNAPRAPAWPHHPLS